jgi:hypothetical protein
MKAWLYWLLGHIIAPVWRAMSPTIPRVEGVRLLICDADPAPARAKLTRAFGILESAHPASLARLRRTRTVVFVSTVSKAVNGEYMPLTRQLYVSSAKVAAADELTLAKYLAVGALVAWLSPRRSVRDSPDRLRPIATRLARRIVERAGVAA